MEKSPDWYTGLGWPLTVMIVAGNGLVIYLISTRKKLRTTTNWFVLSLAMADFSFGLLHFPVAAACNSNDLCTTIKKTTKTFFLYASITNLCTLTLHRYSAIVKPFRHATLMTMKRVVVLLATAWGTTLLLTPLFYFSLMVSPENTYFKKCFWAALSILEVCIIIALIFATSHILLIARRHARQNAALLAQLKFNHQIQHSRVFKPQEAASAKVVAIVMVVFILSILTHLYATFCDISKLCKPFENVTNVCGLLFLINCAVNPVAYAFFKKDIRVELLQLLRCGTVHC